MYIEHFFTLDFDIASSIRMKQPVFGFGSFGEFIYYSHYSRLLKNGRQENWNDTVIRVIEGIMSIRKDWYIKHRIPWNEEGWQAYAAGMAYSMFNMEWLPAGRGLWAMGTPLVYTKGSMPLVNCCYTTIGTDWINDFAWLMDSLMCGAGVSFEAKKTNLKLSEPIETFYYVIPDSREGWVTSVKLLLHGYITGRIPIFDYSSIRAKGEPLKTFGGYASGPQSLIDLHDSLHICCQGYLKHIDGDEIRLKTDIANLIGVCVVAGNLRRSAEMAIGKVKDSNFMNLKDYSRFPERKKWGWMSNNSVKLQKSSDFAYLDSIAGRIIVDGEPGVINMINLKKGRLGHAHDYTLPDPATGINPCSEIPLENREICNLAETLPTRCVNSDQWLLACEYATFYTSTVALLPTHQESTNAIIMRNRRIGVSIVDFIGWVNENGIATVTKWLRTGYKHIRSVNSRLAAAAGVPASIRVTTIKPGGTVPKIAGRLGGISFPNFQHMIRRVRIQTASPVFDILVKAHVPHEVDVVSKDTTVFEFPVYIGELPTIDEISLWQQAMILMLLQREWSDNSVSNTLMFKTSEEKDVANVLAAIMPSIKGVSMLPYETNIYPQMPEERISKNCYLQRIQKINDIDWGELKQDSISEKFCEKETCNIDL